MITPNEVLFYWFLTPTHDDSYLSERMKLWFRKDDATDRHIAERFGAVLAEASAGGLDSWAELSRGRLGLIIVLDQLSRNIHRGQPEAFAADDKARALCLEGLAKGHDQRLHPIERLFFYLPLEHSEDLALQERSVALVGALVEEVPTEVRSWYESFLDYARRHRDVIARFGRFPHRNAILGRPSTPEEASFLEQPGSSF